MRLRLMLTPRFGGVRRQLIMLLMRFGILFPMRRTLLVLPMLHRLAYFARMRR